MWLMAVNSASPSQFSPAIEYSIDEMTLAGEIHYWWIIDWWGRTGNYSLLLILLIDDTFIDEWWLCSTIPFVYYSVKHWRHYYYIILYWLLPYYWYWIDDLTVRLYNDCSARPLQFWQYSYCSVYSQLFLTMTSNPMCGLVLLLIFIIIIVGNPIETYWPIIGIYCDCHSIGRITIYYYYSIIDPYCGSYDWTWYSSDDYSTSDDPTWLQ